MKNVLLLGTGIAFIAMGNPVLAKDYSCPQAQEVTWTLDGKTKSFKDANEVTWTLDKTTKHRPLKGDIVFDKGTTSMEDKFFCRYKVGKTPINISTPVENILSCKLEDSSKLSCKEKG